MEHFHPTSSPERTRKQPRPREQIEVREMLRFRQEVMTTIRQSGLPRGTTVTPVIGSDSAFYIDDARGLELTIQLPILSKLPSEKAGILKFWIPTIRHFAYERSFSPSLMLDLSELIIFSRTIIEVLQILMQYQPKEPFYSEGELRDSDGKVWYDFYEKRVTSAQAERIIRIISEIRSRAQELNPDDMSTI